MHRCSALKCAALRGFPDAPPESHISDLIAERQQLDWLTISKTAPTSPVLQRWQKLSKSSFGRWLFARGVGRAAPYFRTIAPRFIELGPALCRVGLRKRRYFAHRQLGCAPGNELGAHGASMISPCERPRRDRSIAAGPLNHD